ncbi:putative RNA polymerase II subunit B1 CTD phosphatase rpap2 isoform X2 [Clupea harengus]|uniref:RNA polymerase II subunit B1 CTD phosphatase RPAP2 homolog n=1 Tax=Clupea harengus TaxID=7950 RepID=A0A6P3VMJ1_CLUHA|nr:putative RNA polymerase II subunit B1 CTD phosphatase rpap2 isoform X2 [Clupea harengus]
MGLSLLTEHFINPSMENRVARIKSSKGKRVTSKTDDVECKRREILKERLQDKVEHERRAQQVTERLLEDAVSDDFLTRCALLITAENYQDTVEERSIAKLCGYPICPNKLDNVPRQKYKISTKTNKVYDITERKCFCCNFCYKASKWFEVQISKTPLWLRKDDRTPDVTLMKRQEGGSSGLEVPLVDRPVKEADIENPVLPDVEEDSTAIFSNSGDEGNQNEFDCSDSTSKCHRRVHWAELPQGSGAITGTQAEKERQERSCSGHLPKQSETAAIQHSSIPMLSVANGSPEIAKKCSQADGEVEETFLSQSSVRTDNRHLAAPFLQEPSSPTQTTEEESDPPVVQINMTKAGVAELRGQLQRLGVSKSGTTLIKKLGLMERLKLTLMQWKTDETMKLLRGSDYTTGDLHTWQHEMEEELDEDDIQEAPADELYSTGLTGEPMSSSSPDCTTFGRATPTVDVRIKENTTECILPKGTDNQDVPCKVSGSKEPVLPLVDCLSQLVIQKRIVVERLRRSLKNLVGPLRLTMSEVSNDLNNLVRTLRLTNTNIIHRNPEWTVIAVVFLYALTGVSPLLKESLTHPSAVEFISSLMKDLQLTGEDLHCLVRLFCPPPS